MLITVVTCTSVLPACTSLLPAWWCIQSGQYRTKCYIQRHPMVTACR